MDKAQKKILVETVKKKFEQIKPGLTEKEKRSWAASESLKIGHGGDGIAQKATGISRPTIRKGRNEIQNNVVNSLGRIRKYGSGRKSIFEKHRIIEKKLDSLIDPFSREEGRHPTLRWTRKSTAILADELNQLINPETKSKGSLEPEKPRIIISQKTLYSAMKSLGYDMRLNKKVPSKLAPLMNIQFHVIYEAVKKHNQSCLPVISIDLIKVDQCNGDLDDPMNIKNEIWEKVPVGDHTAFAVVESIQQWIDEAGQISQINLSEVLVTVDGERNETLKQGLQELSNKNRMIIQLCYFPPCTRRWYKIEKKIFFPFSVSRSGIKSEKLCSIVNLIVNPTKNNRLKNASDLSYDHAINLKNDKQLGIWNDIFIPISI